MATADMGSRPPQVKKHRVARRTSSVQEGIAEHGEPDVVEVPRGEQAVLIGGLGDTLEF